MLALRTYNHVSSNPVNAILNEWNRMWPTPEVVRRSPAPQRPRLACRDHDDRHEIFAALPGLKRSELAIEVADRVLILRKIPEVSTEATPEGEETQGSKARPLPFAITKGFEQRIALPEDGDLSKISAHLEAGILTITVPKKAEPAPVSIAITGD